MKLKITIDIFSGRQNPVIELTGKEAQEVMERLKPAEKIKKGKMGLPPTPTLGYRGLIVEQMEEPIRGLPKILRMAHGNMFAPNFARQATDEAFEDFFCGSTGPIRNLQLGEKFPGFVRNEIERFRNIRLKWPWDEKLHSWPIITSCKCAPLYEPNWWNDGGQKQLNNNCYNYATNYRTDTFAQPGAGTGAMYGAITCSEVKNAAIRDELIDKSSANNKCPSEGHLVALVIAPGWDFHWFRKGRNEYWSHKPGSTSVTNLDNSNAAISDPRTANRGAYTEFCTFMVVKHGHIKIQ